MVRITIKGGIWKNTEDEILKAAVMKYGKNQWSRIASLLHRKSSKQCKARWYEWLDPSIKKTEWSKEEDENLLHMAKLLPTQWRTIAPFVGRTANQCLERYEFLLDQAQKKLDGPDFSNLQSTTAGGTTLSDPRKLRVGEIDPNPEAKPARPDPEDMDEDELEMLSEARARLANTQGKKAKRKARERQLEEARRLASMQKRRELRAGGIEVPLRDPFRGRKNRRHVNYNTEIAFEKPVPKGFYDTSKETYVGKEFDFKSLRVDHMEKEYRDEKERKAKEEDKKKIELKRKQNLPETLLETSDNFKTMKRTKLSLPEPQMNDQELDDVIKISKLSQQQIDEVKNDDDDDDGNNNNPTNILLNEYKLTSDISTLRTPLVPQSDDIVMQQATNLLLDQLVDTPLNHDGSESIKPSRNNIQINSNLNEIQPEFDENGKIKMKSNEQRFKTPNTLFTPSIQNRTNDNNSIQTPSVRSVTSTTYEGGQTRGELRDRLQLNTPFNDDGSMSIRSVASTISMTKSELKENLKRLPKPKNDYEIVVNDETEDDNNEKMINGKIVDKREIEEKSEREKLLIEIKKFFLHSTNFKDNRRIPLQINTVIGLSNPTSGTSIELQQFRQAEKMLNNEMILLQHFDLSKQNPKYTYGIPKNLFSKMQIVNYDDNSDDDDGDDEIDDDDDDDDDEYREKSERWSSILKVESFKELMEFSLTTKQLKRFYREKIGKLTLSETKGKYRLPNLPSFQLKKHEMFMEQNEFDEFSNEELNEGKIQIEKEVEELEREYEKLDFERFSQIWDNTFEQMIYVPSMKKFTNQKNVAAKYRIESLENVFKKNQQQMEIEAKRGNKLEGKIRKYLGGYAARAQKTIKQFNLVIDTIDQYQIQLNTFERLKTNEDKAIKKRLNSLMIDVNQQKKRDDFLQNECDKILLNLRRLKEDRKKYMLKLA